MYYLVIQKHNCSEHWLFFCLPISLFPSGGKRTVFHLETDFHWLTVAVSASIVNHMAPLLYYWGPCD